VTSCAYEHLGRHLIVDTIGMIIAAVVHAANIRDRDGAKLVFATLADRFPRLTLDLRLDRPVPTTEQGLRTEHQPSGGAATGDAAKFSIGGGCCHVAP
jgi:hypothetical protein